MSNKEFIFLGNDIITHLTQYSFCFKAYNYLQKTLIVSCVYWRGSNRGTPSPLHPACPSVSSTRDSETTTRCVMRDCSLSHKHVKLFFWNSVRCPNKNEKQKRSLITKFSDTIGTWIVYSSYWIWVTEQNIPIIYLCLVWRLTTMGSSSWHCHLEAIKTFLIAS